MFANFDPSLFDDTDFKEDAVREVIITPMLTRRGYSPSGSTRIVRSKTLIHPFIYAGTRKVPVKLIPDYTLLNDTRALLILDAKRPSEDILSREHIQQAYSYAIHPEIKCCTLALCNGKHLVVFDVDRDDPLLVIGFDKYESEWSTIEKYLSLKFLKDPKLRKFEADFGCALARLGFPEGGKLTLLPAKFNMFARLDYKLMSATANIDFADSPHCVSFDFEQTLLPKILSCLPKELSDAFSDALSKSPFQAAAELAIELDIDTRLGPEIDGQSEKFRPLIIENVIAARFNPLPLENDAADIPGHIFRLRKSYVLRSSV